MGDRSPVVIEGRTIVDAFRRNVRRSPHAPALHFYQHGIWTSWSWSEYGRAVAEVGAGLADIGLVPADVVGILSENRAEWHLADFGLLGNGAVSVPLYPTSSPEQIASILGHAGARFCIVEDEGQLEKTLRLREQLPDLERVFVMEPLEVDDPLVMPFSELRIRGGHRLGAEPQLFESRAGAIDPQQLATLVYTSGTTGPPKGAMISHANVMWTLRSCVSFFGLRRGERFLSFLPLSHIAERMISDFASTALGGETWFARSLATLAEDLQACRPTVFFAVPRIWEKVLEGVHHSLEDHEILRLVVGSYAQLDQRAAARRAEGSLSRTWTELPKRVLRPSIAHRIRHELGLGRARLLASSAAPISADLLRQLDELGLPVVEVYGQTETCGPTTANRPNENHIGTVGKPIPGVEIRIADDGEILVRGGNVCTGYFRDPEGTAQLIDTDGWLHSGDMGVVDDDGYLRVIGRKKDLIITAAGQNVAPQSIESDLSSHELLSGAVVVGDGRRYLTALLALSFEGLARWAKERGKGLQPEDLVQDPDVHDEVGRIVSEVNARHARVEHIRAFRILGHEFALASGEMTQTLKVKRNVVIEQNRELIEDMYDGSAHH